MPRLEACQHGGQGMKAHLRLEISAAEFRKAALLLLHRTAARICQNLMVSNGGKKGHDLSATPAAPRPRRQTPAGSAPCAAPNPSASPPAPAPPAAARPPARGSGRAAGSAPAAQQSRTAVKGPHCIKPARPANAAANVHITEGRGHAVGGSLAATTQMTLWPRHEAGAKPHTMRSVRDTHHTESSLMQG